MKSTTRVLLGGLLACAFAANAQPVRSAGGTPADSATMVQRQVSRLTTLLTLTANQVTQATTIFTNAQTAAAALQTTLSTNRESLRTAVKGNATATIDQLSSAIGTLTGQITAIQSRADAAFYALLTAEQKARFDELDRPGGPRGRGPGGPR